MAMVFERVYLGCLAQAAYVIGSQGRAVVVDPRRDIDDYLAVARAHDLEITDVVLTHIHADFVAGHVELAQRCGATIRIGRRADVAFPCEPLAGGDRLSIGEVEIEVLETPGHTPDGICLLVRDRSTPEQPARLLTGDTLFLGDVGRPDLAGGLGYTARDMAAMMHASLRDVIAPLPDDVVVFPGHGAGSACGRSISDAESSTLAQQRLTNPALRPMSEREFVDEVTTDLADPPAYFPRAAALNRAGPRLWSELPPLTRLEVRALADSGAQIVDTRSAERFGDGHLQGSVNIGLGGSFESWCGRLLDLDRPIALVVDDAAAAEQARMRLGRVALEDVVGFLPANALRANDGLETLPQIAVRDLDGLRRESACQIVDVRGPAEYDGGHAPGAVPLPLPALAHGAPIPATLDRTRPTAVICGSGYRSSAAAHWLRRAGFADLRNVAGGTNAWRAAQLELET